MVMQHALKFLGNTFNMKKFEYKVLMYKSWVIRDDAGKQIEMERDFSKLGDDGWELFNIITAPCDQWNQGIVLYHFKRELKRK